MDLEVDTYAHGLIGRYLWQTFFRLRLGFIMDLQVDAYGRVIVDSDLDLINLLSYAKSQNCS